MCIVHGNWPCAWKLTTVKYDSLSQLLVLFTKFGMQSFINYCQPSLALSATTDTHIPPRTNITSKQEQKLYPLEMCAHEGFHNLNIGWIWKVLFPGVDKTLSLEPDPICTWCTFDKVCCISHKARTGHISSNHKTPEEGVTSDSLESGTPGRPFTT